MAFERRYGGLTKPTRTLLDGGESARVDFKKNVAGLSVDDLVAFANTSSGGSILIGVVEGKRSNGAQFGEIVGHDISDETALTIVNKAIACVPPVPVKLYAEDLDHKPIIRIQVLPGSERPHSTPKGIFFTRDGSRNRALLPKELLAVFLDAEAGTFAARFEEAAGAVTTAITLLEAFIDDKIDEIADQLGWAESRVDDTELSIETVGERVEAVDDHLEELEDHVSDIGVRLRTLFQQDKRVDPVIAYAEGELFEMFKLHLSVRPDLVKRILDGEELPTNVNKRQARELQEVDRQRILRKAAQAVAQAAKPRQ